MTVGRGLLTIALATALLPPPAAAQSVDQIVRREMRERRIPGVAIAVMKDGRLIKAEGYGLANVELDVSVTPATVFQSGSVGKQFTAAGIMLLVEDGTLRLDAPVGTYLPEAPAAWRDITIRHLLTHTSGIKNYGPTDIDFRLDYTEEELLAKIAAFPLDFAPGDQWSYSNTGYVVLGILIHRVTGEFYGDFLDQRIFKPLGMTATRVVSEADIIRNRAAGYRLVRGELKNQKYIAQTLNSTADGSLYVTVLDLAKWDAALMGDRLLSRASLAQMWTPVTLNNGVTYPYGFGWSLDEIRGHRMVEHTGAWQGFTTAICRYVDDRLSIVVLTNLDVDHARPDRILYAVAGTYLRALAPPPSPTPITDGEPEVTAVVRDFITRAAAGRDVRGLLTGDAARKYGGDGLGTLREYLDEAGSLKALELLERTTEKDVRRYRYRVRYEFQTDVVEVDLTADNKMAEWEIVG